MKRGLINILVALAVAPGARAGTPAEQHFIARVKPLLDSRCISCHGPDKVKGGLRLDSRAAMLKGGENGPALVPGQPSESLLLQAVMHAKRDLEMPPKEKLTTNDIAVLRRWVQEGAPWPETATNSAAAVPIKPGERIGDAWHDQRNPIVRIFGGQRLDLWSLQPVKRVEPLRLSVLEGRLAGSPRPVTAKGGTIRNSRNVSLQNSVRNPIDNFILARLVEQELRPSPEADRRTLARRLYYDLTGLPPTPGQMSEFMNDRRRDACERLVEQLLASPRYGEHQARLWMDVVRYSDSNGFDWDEFRPKAWRFRDYLIRSFNADKPFTQLIREELAGDELLDGPPKNSVEQDALIATGYLRLGPQDNSAALFKEQDRARAELMADLTETTASAFLGLTMSCNRCHDHKYDPLSQADHYRMRAFFDPANYADDAPVDLAPEQELIRAHNQALDDKLKPLQEKRDALLGAVKKKLREEKVARLPPEDQALLATPKEKRTNDLPGKVEALEKKVEVKDKDVQAALAPEQKMQTDALGKEIEALRKKKRSFTLALLMTDNPEKITATRILFQGNHKDPRDAVVPGFISVLDPNPAEIHQPRNAKTTGRRLTLADWIASTNNPLTARVFVNRVWQQHFGRGLVATPNDFGLAGARPSHPELLDWLASEFVREGWSVKALHRLIVTSATYRQASSVEGRTSKVEGRKTTAVDVRPSPFDPENALLARQNLRRLTAEQLRDSLLGVSGLLRLDHAGGPPIWPELPPEILQANPAFLDDNETKTKGWYPSPKTNQSVRSVFLVQKKTVRVPFMETFDLPENSVSCARRTESTVAPQALSLLNNALTIDAARALAERVQREAGTNEIIQVERAFALALQRAPDHREREACVALLRQRSRAESLPVKRSSSSTTGTNNSAPPIAAPTERSQSVAPLALAELCRALLNLNEFVYLD